MWISRPVFIHLSQKKKKIYIMNPYISDGAHHLERILHTCYINKFVCNDIECRTPDIPTYISHTSQNIRMHTRRCCTSLNTQWHCRIIIKYMIWVYRHYTIQILTIYTVAIVFAGQWPNFRFSFKTHNGLIKRVV